MRVNLIVHDGSTKRKMQNARAIKKRKPFVIHPKTSKINVKSSVCVSGGLGDLTAHIAKTTRRQTTWNSRFRLEFAVWAGICEFRLMAGGNRRKQLEITKQRGIHRKAVQLSKKA